MSTKKGARLRQEAVARPLTDSRRSTAPTRPSRGCAVDGDWICFRGIKGDAYGGAAGDDPRGNGHLLSPAEWRLISDSLGLSPRQVEVCRYLLEGCSDKQIAAHAGIKLPTVRTHLNRVFQKLEVDDRTELVLRLFVEFRAVCLGGPVGRQPPGETAAVGG